jgi:uncharacterized protein YaaQ
MLVRWQRASRYTHRTSPARWLFAALIALEHLMKLVVAVVQDYDAAELVKAMIEAGFRVTMLASTGGFLRSGNTTLMSGIEDGQLEELLAIIRVNCRERTETLRFSAEPDFPTWYPQDVVDVQVGGANVFVMDLERFEQI